MIGKRGQLVNCRLSDNNERVMIFVSEEMKILSRNDTV